MLVAEKQWKSGFVSDDRMETLLDCHERRYFFGAVPREAL